MAKFSGLIGFSHTQRTRPGVSSEVITEKGPYSGDVKRRARSMSQVDSANAELSTTTTIEVVKDAYLSENMFAIRFVEWAGAPWIVTEVEEKRPRLLLRLGGVYRGARAKSAPPAGTPAGPAES